MYIEKLRNTIIIHNPPPSIKKINRFQDQLCKNAIDNYDTH